MAPLAPSFFFFFLRMLAEEAGGVLGNHGARRPSPAVRSPAGGAAEIERPFSTTIYITSFSSHNNYRRIMRSSPGRHGFHLALKVSEHLSSTSNPRMEHQLSHKEGTDSYCPNNMDHYDIEARKCASHDSQRALRTFSQGAQPR